MKYELMWIKNNHVDSEKVEFNVIRRFSEKEYKEIKDCKANILYFQGLTFSWRAVLESLYSIKECVKVYENSIRGDRNASRDYNEKVGDICRINALVGRSRYRGERAGFVSKSSVTSFTLILRIG